MTSKRIIYVGGLDLAVNEELLHAAFIPFGEIKSVQIPKDFVENKIRGFGFVEFELEEDASDAIDNMSGAELLGKVLRCSYAKQWLNFLREKLSGIRKSGFKAISRMMKGL